MPPVDKEPEEYIEYGRPIPPLQLGNTTPEHIIKIIKKFQPKSSCDVHGVSTKMIKFIGEKIAIPLAHIFNLSPQLVNSHPSLSNVVSSPSLRRETSLNVTIIGQFLC